MDVSIIRAYLPLQCICCEKEERIRLFLYALVMLAAYPCTAVPKPQHSIEKLSVGTHRCEFLSLCACVEDIHVCCALCKVHTPLIMYCGT